MFCVKVSTLEAVRFNNVMWTCVRSSAVTELRVLEVQE